MTFQHDHEPIAALGQDYLDQDQYDEAIEIFRHAHTVSNECPKCRRNLARALRAAGRFAEALDILTIPQLQTPFDPEMMAEYRHTLFCLRRYVESLRISESLLDVKDAPARYHHAMALDLLVCGNYQQGWREYESRLAQRDLYSAFLSNRQVSESIPEWRGQSLAGRAIVLVAERGLGDNIQFVRYAQVLQKQGATVYVVCDLPLVSLMKTTVGVADAFVHLEPNIRVNYRAWMMSLPLHTGLHFPEDAPTPPYFTIPEVERGVFTVKSGDCRPRVGLMTQGSPCKPYAATGNSFAYSLEARQKAKRRDMPVECAELLRATPEIRWVDLSRDGVVSEIPADSSIGVTRQSGYHGDFRDTAALILTLDLVISVDTAIAHLSGALGVPTWLLSRHDACWRWRAPNRRTHFYPDMLIHYAAENGDWKSMVRSISQKLQIQKHEFAARKMTNAKSYE